MQKKQLDFEQLFDIRALRIIAERLQDCYAALGTVHSQFRHIPKEFDDYIATPKQNGYQSIHTVVVGPEGKSIEIQIRTQQMHQDAELGVAAHWKYKEGSNSKQDSADERVNWLRKILQWQEEMAESGNLVEEFRSQVFEDRVYVFTPKGDVIDLPQGATPLDFAYYIHSNVGHRCTGAKIDDRIVPFSYKLKTGDTINILTSKNATPSRDWMHPGLGYVHTARARATVHSYFKKQDRSKNIDAGKELLERELNKVNIALKHAAEFCEKYNVKTVEDLYAAIGTGDVRVMNLVNALQQKYAPPEEAPVSARISKRSRKSTQPIIAEGVGNLLSVLAKCCQPVAGDDIVGYITLGKGVSVHKENCPQLDNLLKMHPEREIEVSWAEGNRGAFSSTLDVLTVDRDGILRDMTTELSNEKIALLGVNSFSNTSNNTALIKLTVEVPNASLLNKLIARLRVIDGVLDISRH
jgi:GTP pyrophosphokinase